MKGKDGLILVCCLAVICTILSVGIVRADYTGRFVKETADSSGDVGQYTSLAFDAAGNPCISYYDVGNNDLKYAYRSGGTWQNTTVDAGGDVGQYTSLAFDDSGNPCISYIDQTNRVLKYAYRSGGTWYNQTVDSSVLVRGFTSLAFDGPGNPCISYTSWTKGALKYAYRSGGTWQNVTVDATGGGGQYTFQYTSLAFDGSGNPCISYFNQSMQALKYAYRSGGTWQNQTVNAAGEGGSDTSLAFDGSGNPCISYYDGTNGDLEYTRKSGGTWYFETVDPGGDVGMFTSLAFDSSGSPCISYWDRDQLDLKFAWRPVGTWNNTTVDSASGVGYWSSLALDGAGNPCISYYDWSNGHLKYASFVPAPAVLSITPGSGVRGTTVAVTDLHGSDFVNGATVRLNRSGQSDIPAVSVTVVSTDRITCTIPVPPDAEMGAWNVVVTNPDLQSGTLADGFTIGYPVSTITNLNPSSCTAGGTVFTLAVTGTSFVPGSVVRWNGADKSTSFGSATQLTATIPASDIATGGSYPVTVFNPPPGGGTSNIFYFVVNNPVPAITTLSPPSVKAGHRAFTLTVNGNYFVSTGVVRWNGAARTTTFVSPERLTVKIKAKDVKKKGKYTVTVFNPEPGGGVSNAVKFKVI